MANNRKNAEKDALRRIGVPVRKPGSHKAQPTLVELSMEFARAVRARGNPAEGLPVDKEFIDSLYESESGDFSLTDIERA